MKKFHATQVNDQVLINILRAIKNVQAGFSVDHVRNKAGKAYLAVRRSNSVNSDGARMFEITDKTGNCIRRQLSHYILARSAKQGYNPEKVSFVNRPISTFIINFVTWS